MKFVISIIVALTAAPAQADALKDVCAMIGAGIQRQGELVQIALKYSAKNRKVVGVIAIANPNSKPAKSIKVLIDMADKQLDADLKKTMEPFATKTNGSPQSASNRLDRLVDLSGNSGFHPPL